jgi:hypothetical protein
VNRNTLIQWWTYQERSVACPDCAWLLGALVADHNAATGITRPGYRRLTSTTRRSRAWVSTHLRHLEDEGHVKLVKGGQWKGHGHNDAAEYSIPWLNNPPSSVQIQTERQTEGWTERQATTSTYGRTATRRRLERPAAVGFTDDQGFEHPSFCGCRECNAWRASGAAS